MEASENEEEIGTDSSCSCRKSRLDSGYSSSLVSPSSSLPKPDMEHCFSDDDVEHGCQTQERISRNEYSQFELRMFRLFPASTEKKVINEIIRKKKKINKIKNNEIKNIKIIDHSTKIFRKIVVDLNISSNLTPLKSSLTSPLPLKLYSETIEKFTPKKAKNTTLSQDSEAVWSRQLHSCVDNLFEKHDFPENNKITGIIQIKSPPHKIFLRKHSSFSVPFTPFNTPSLCLVNDSKMSSSSINFHSQKNTYKPTAKLQVEGSSFSFYGSKVKRKLSFEA